MKKLPQLPLDQWEPTKNTLHLFMQIVGKIRMQLFPKTNHWWHVPLYVNCRGLTTRPIPYEDRVFEIRFDFLDHQLIIECSDGESRTLPLTGQSVASFYQQLFAGLKELGIEVNIKAVPYDVPFSTIPFAEDHTHNAYDAQWVGLHWQILSFVNSNFEIFRGRFLGKSTPVHLFWHHADLALTRFSGKKGPALQDRSKADQEAYSHEVISFGYWVGDDVIREPAFYVYVYPEPENITHEKLLPESARWNTDFGYSMAFLPYEAVRAAAQPGQVLLQFLESAYQVCATRAGWELAEYKME